MAAMVPERSSVGCRHNFVLLGPAPCRTILPITKHHVIPGARIVRTTVPSASDKTRATTAKTAQGKAQQELQHTVGASPLSLTTSKVGSDAGTRAATATAKPKAKRTSSGPPPLPATATKQVAEIWAAWSAGLEEPQQHARASKASSPAAKGAAAAQDDGTDAAWTLTEEQQDPTGRTAYGNAVLGDLRLTPGSLVRLGRAGGAAMCSPMAVSRTAVKRREVDDVYAMVQCIYREGGEQGPPKVQLRRLLHGSETILGKEAGPLELFLLDTSAAPAVYTVADKRRQGADRSSWLLHEQAWRQQRTVVSLPLAGDTVVEVLEAECLCRPTDHGSRQANIQADEARSRRDADRAAAGLPPVFVYRHMYCPLLAMFRRLKVSELSLGTYVEPPSSMPEPFQLGQPLPGPATQGLRYSGFSQAGVDYQVGEFLYIRATALDAAVARAAAAAAGSLEGSEGAAAALSAGAAAAASTTEDEDDVAEEADDEEEEEGGDVEGEEEEEALNNQAAASLSSSVVQKSRKRLKGANDHNRAWQVVQLVAVEAASPQQADGVLQVRRFYRPEDISRGLAYASDWWDLYAPAGGEQEDDDVSALLDVSSYEVYGKCRVVLPEDRERTQGAAAAPRPQQQQQQLDLDTFTLVGCHDPRQPGKVGPLPPHFRLQLPAAGGTPAASEATLASAVSAPETAAGPHTAASGEGSDFRPLRTLDVFAGCGGLSEGLHQAGVADTRWAIEFDPEAAAAFQLNNPGAAVFADNCCVLLRAAMERAGALDDCASNPACEEAVKALPASRVSQLPQPGDVELLAGGPPCQGYSGMNRFHKGEWSQGQNSLVMTYLSYCDFYRPRYFLLENVRNLVSYGKGRVFRLALRSLLDMGYQVRFGILNAGNFGVPQSRARTFLWAAQPDEQLPDWPRALHAHRGSCPGAISMPLPPGATLSADGSYYAAPPVQGAPLRPVTVRDALDDLPAVGPGAGADRVSQYATAPVSPYQKVLRRGSGASDSDAVVRDHASKALSELNRIRLKHIPTASVRLGADWRALRELVQERPEMALVATNTKMDYMVPQCLLNTADRHNDWNGLFGRLLPDGYFPTITTDPNPLGKVGQVIHPEQDRIVTARECARGQGFPDHYQFSGKLNSRYRQIGNAVAPPLARQLGLQLRKAVEAAKQAKAGAA